MRRLLALVVAAITVAAALAACGEDEPNGATPAPSTPASGSTTPDAQRGAANGLAGQQFFATTATGRTLVADSELKLSFGERELGGSAGCNALGLGRYTVKDGKLQVEGEAASTMMACSRDLMDQEKWFKDWARSGLAITTNGETLTLSGDGVTVEFSRDTRASARPPIVGTDWVLDQTITRGEDPVDVPASAEPPTLTISETGDATLFTGCNRGQSTVDVRDDGFIVFDRIATTRKACKGDGGRLELAVLTVLDGNVAAGYDGDGRLSLAKNGNTLLYRAR